MTVTLLYNLNVYTDTYKENMKEGLPVEVHTWLHELGRSVRQYVEENRENLTRVNGDMIPAWCQMHAFVAEVFLQAVGTPDIRVCYLDIPRFHFFVCVGSEGSTLEAVLDCYPEGLRIASEEYPVVVCTCSKKSGGIATRYFGKRDLEPEGGVSRSSWSDLINHISSTIEHNPPDLTGLSNTNPYRGISQ